MEKILDAFDNEIHIGDYVVTSFSAGKYWSGISYAHKVLDFRYDASRNTWKLVLACNYPPDVRGGTTEYSADSCMLTTLHNYINSQKKILCRIREERAHQDASTEYTLYTSPTRRELYGIHNTADWQRPYMPRYYYDKKVNDWVLNHPQTRKRKARKTNRFVMTDVETPPKHTFR